MTPCRWCRSVVCRTHLRCAGRFGGQRWTKEWLSFWVVLGIVDGAYRREADYIERTRGSKLTNGEVLNLRFAAIRAAREVGVEVRFHA